MTAPTDTLFQVQEYLVRTGVTIPPWRAGDEERARFVAAVAKALVELRVPLAPDKIPADATRLAGMMLGVGVLTPLLQEDGVEEIIVRGGHVQVERFGRIEDWGDFPDEHFERVANRAADLGERAMTGSKPWVLVDLPDGNGTHRFTAIKPPLSRRGVAINIRVFPRNPLTLDGLVQRQALPAHLAGFLRQVVSANAATVLVSGEFGSGKTTLLNALTTYLPHTAPLAICETFEELRPGHPYAARTVVSAQREEGRVEMRDVIDVIYTRMRPDMILVGEIVSGEAVDLLKAINLGKRAMSTIHGDTPLDALYRLEILALEKGLPVAVSRELAARAIDLVVHLRRDGARRFVSEVTRVAGLDDAGRYALVPLYQAPARTRADVLDDLWRSHAC